MKLTIVAATGRIGRLLVDQAQAAGHDVTAVARHPDGFRSEVRIVQADLLHPAPTVLASALDGADAVLSGLGPRSKTEYGIASKGTRPIVDAMKEAGVRRIVAVSAAPVSTTASAGRPQPPRHDPGEGFVMRHLLTPVIKAVLRDHYDDLALMEDILRDSGLDWTVVRPPQLKDKPLTATYRTAFEHNLRGGASVSRADVAHVMLAVLDRPETIGHAIGIAS
jgi:putative NADH-flavin reductase